MLKSAAAIKNIYFTVLRVGRPIFRNSVVEIGRTVTQAGVNGYVVPLRNNCSRYSACTEIERRVLARAVRGSPRCFGVPGSGTPMRPCVSIQFEDRGAPRDRSRGSALNLSRDERGAKCKYGSAMN